MSERQIIKAQQGGSLRDFIGRYKFQRPTAQASSTAVAPKVSLTKKQAEENRDKVAYNNYVAQQKERDRVQALKQKGQTDGGNLASDIGTSLLKQVTEFRFANDQDFEKGRGSWKGRQELLVDGAINGMANEMTGGAMNYVGSKIASGAAKQVIGKTVDLAKKAVNNAHVLNPNAFKPNPNSYYRIVGTDATEDALANGVIRSKAGAGVVSEKVGGINLGSRPTAYPSFSKGKVSTEYAKGLPEHSLIETQRPMAASTVGRHGKGTTQFPVDEAGNYMKEFPLSEAKIMQPHWWKGYKEVPQIAAMADEVVAPKIGMGERIKNSLYDNVVYPVKHARSIYGLKGKINSRIAEMNTPEGIARLEAQHINSKEFFDKPVKVTSKPTEKGSSYNFDNDTINIDFDQMNRFKTTEPTLNLSATIDHELAHRTQGFGKTNSVTNYVKGEYGKEAPTEVQRILTPLDLNSRRMLRHDIKTSRGHDNADYFYSNKPEPMPHLAESRRNMIDQKILNNRYDEITVDKLYEYQKANPTDRIGSFMTKDFSNYDVLQSLMNKLPAVAPIVGAAVIANKNK